MTRRLSLCTTLATLGALLMFSSSVRAEKIAAPVNQRFAGDTDETPNFRRHVIALVGRLGCNGRACHGSFQGKGDFRFSLFGYDFAADHKNMLAPDSQDGVPRANVKDPESSYLLAKPTLQMDHDGGERFKVGSWQYKLLLRWIQAGAPSVAKDDAEFVSLEITPSEIVFAKKGESVQLKVIAQWSDGSKEDVTCLCRFQTKNDEVAKINASGKITSNKPGDTHVVVNYDNGVKPIPVMHPVSDQVGANYPDVPVPTKIDRLVVQKLRKLGIVPSALSSDAEFLRRVSLDMTGTLPSSKEVVAFLADRSQHKRAVKIDELLKRPSYAAWWATRLCDITGNNDTQLANVVPGRNGGASRDWYEWIRKRVADNEPYDELAAGIILATSRNKGENYTQYAESMSKLYGKNPEGGFADRDCMPHYWARRNFRTKEDRAIGFAYSFMGLRIQCAQCHKHPFDQWTKQDFEKFSGFFTGVVADGRTVRPDSQQEYDAIAKKLGIKGKKGGQIRKQLVQLLQQGKTIPFPEVFAAPAPKIKTVPNDKKNRKRRRGRTRRASSATVLGGEAIDLTTVDDIRTPLMNWLREKDNPYFARAFVNRIWAGYFNVGIVEPPDDLSLANPPSNRPLLDYLTEAFIEHDYDMKWLHREIALSRTYQLSWKPNDTNLRDEKNFSRAVPRRLPAEVAVDAVIQATASDEQVEKLIRDVTGRSISIPGTGGRNKQNANYALTIFGRSTRESNCDCDRSMDASLLQTVYLQNDREILARIDSRQGWLSQVARQIGGQLRATSGGRSSARVKAAQAALKRQNAAYKRQFANVQKQIKKAKQAGNEKLIKRLEQQLVALKRRAKAAIRSNPSAAKKPIQSQAEKKPMDTSEIVKQAYLRTLSRLPREEELARCRKEIEQAEDRLSGVRNVLWALLNTKEFIVNH